MKKARLSDRALVVDILATSFEDNASVNYVIKQDHLRLKRIRMLMEYSFDVCYRFGDVYLSDDDHACALILYPDKQKTTLRSFYLDFKLAFLSIGLANIKRVLNRQIQVRKHHPQMGKYCHGWYLAVDPQYRKGGTGLHFIHELIRKSESLNMNIFIETSAIRNLPLYQYLGFEVIDELASEYTLYFLKRNRK